MNKYLVYFTKIAKYYITELEKSMKGTYETLAHLQKCILTIKSNKTGFIFISRFYLYYPITIWYIYEKITELFWPDNIINHFFNLLHRVLSLNGLTIKKNITVNLLNKIWSFFFREKPAMISLIARHLNNVTYFSYFCKNAVTKLMLFLGIIGDFWI